MSLQDRTIDELTRSNEVIERHLHLKAIADYHKAKSQHPDEFRQLQYQINQILYGNGKS